jgi:hypothetical protein
MRRIRLLAIPLMVGALSVAVVVQAESKKQIQPVKIKPTPASIPQTPALTGSKQGYRLVTDVLDGFGGASQSDNYRIPVNSGGQASAGGLSESHNYRIKAGYVHSSHVMRGDATGDGLIDVADVLYLIDYLFLGTSAPCPMEAGDATCDGIVDVADVLFLINYLFLGTSPPGC